MVNDPYQVLGISRNASPEEIKKAYRKKAKEFHPDLHPGDAQAAEKMNEVNEAYDMLQHPEKYEAKKRQQERARGAGDTARSAGSGYGYGGTGGYGQGGYGGHQSNTDWGFDFEKMFGFGFGESQVVLSPRAQMGDPRELVSAIEAVHARAYQRAVDILSGMTSAQRNHRWFYVAAVAYEGLGVWGKALRLRPGFAGWKQPRACEEDQRRGSYHQKGGGEPL